MVLLGSHHHTDETKILHTLKQLTTYYDDISTVTYAPSITIDHSRLLLEKFILNAWITQFWNDWISSLFVGCIFQAIAIWL